VTGFCIGGTALANVIGIPYINKRLSLSHAVRLTTLFIFAKLIITVFFEVLGNVFLSKYILEKTVTETINYITIYNNQDL
jgi:hypothetical protein